MWQVYTYWTCNCYRTRIEWKINSLIRRKKYYDILRYDFRIAIRYKFFLYCNISIYRYIVTPLLSVRQVSPVANAYIQHLVLSKLIWQQIQNNQFSALYAYIHDVIFCIFNCKETRNIQNVKRTDVWCISMRHLQQNITASFTLKISGETRIPRTVRFSYSTRTTSHNIHIPTNSKCRIYTVSQEPQCARFSHVFTCPPIV